MSNFRHLYIDIDHTLFSRYFNNTDLELRPAIMSQLRVLSRLFHCHWLTCWSLEDIKGLLRYTYSYDLVKVIGYADWGHGHPRRKAGFVLSPKAPKNFWWLENELFSVEKEALKEERKTLRFIQVDSRGPWGFSDACLELFRRAKVSEADIVGARGSMRLFRKETYLDPVVFPA